MNIFERASRAQLRFDSPAGLLTTEQLWELPLTSNGRSSQHNLDAIARGVNRELKSLEEESFVDVKPDQRRIDQQLRLDILKHIIASKVADKKAAEAAAERAERKQKILAALASKQDKALEGMSEEDLKKELAAL